MSALLQYLSTEERDEIRETLARDSAAGCSPDLDAMQCAVLIDLLDSRHATPDTSSAPKSAQVGALPEARIEQERKHTPILKAMAEELDKVIRAYDSGTGEQFGDAQIAFDNALAKHLDALASPASAPPGWKPIESAPKDGTQILAYRPLAALTNDPLISIVHSINRDSGCWNKTVPEGMDSTNYTSGYCKPTHWMELPAAPDAAMLSGEPQQPAGQLSGDKGDA